MHGDRRACGRVVFQRDDLRVADWRGCGNLDLTVGDLRDGLRAS